MMISQKMADAINNQINFEFFSYWTYQAMAFKLDNMGLKIFTKWFDEQALEEVAHAMKMSTYLLDQGAEVILTSLDQPKNDYKNVEEVVQVALDHEIEVTRRINKLMALAKDENDFPTSAFMQWFVDEQVEEVATVNQLLDMVKMTDSTGQLLLLENRIMELRQPSSAAE